MSEPPRREKDVTFLMTDVVDSTALTRRLGDQRAFEVMRAHDALIRATLARTSGEEVERVGDGFLLAFENADPALRCARMIQEARSALGRDLDGLEIRIGVHAGTAIYDAGIYFGAELIRCSRICQAAVGAEVLCSRSVRDASQRHRVEFGRPRRMRLKGFIGVSVLYPLLSRRSPATGERSHGPVTARRAPGRTP